MDFFFGLFLVFLMGGVLAAFAYKKVK